MIMGERLRLLWTRVGVRTRLTAASVAIVGVVFMVAGVAMPGTIQALLVASTRQAVTLRAHDIASQVALRGVASVQGLLGAAHGDATLVQILDVSGAVVASTPDVSGEAAMVDRRTLTSLPSSQQQPLAFVDNVDYVIAAERAGAAPGAPVVLAAQSLALVQRNAHIMAAVIYGTLPVLLLLVGWATWVAVGRSLRSIDAIRRRVDRIGAAELHARVPVPAADDEVAHLASTMNRMLGRIESSALAQRRFIADASHELRSPLTSMRAMLEVAQRTDSADLNDADSAQLLGAEVERMTRLVEDLLLLANMDELALAMRVEDVDLDDIVQAEGKRVAAQSALTVELHFEPVRVLGDADRLAQAVRNLVDNAMRYARTRIGLTLLADAAMVRLVVDDDGSGIPAAERERVLERFVRLDDHRGREAGGSGLGLAITSEIVRRHGGSVVVGSNDWGGASFAISLPYGADVDPTASSR